MTVCYLALGSNLGEREAHLARAREELEARGARILRQSTVHDTEPYGVLDQPRFLNQVLEVEWAGSPRELSRATQAVEAAVGRQETYRWGPREIDVAILLFGALTTEEKDLTIPHPGVAERDCVRAPLAELRPDTRG